MSQTKAQLLDGKSATIQFTSGSASAPSVSFTGDTNTGIYSPGADQVAISTGGSGRLFVNADGTITLGSFSATASPTIRSTASPTLSFSDNTNSAYVGLIGAQNRLINFSSGGGTLIQSPADVNVVVTGSNSIIASTANTERLRITSAGLVGVGTSSPSAPLHAQGVIRSDAVAAGSDLGAIQFGYTGGTINAEITAIRITDNNTNALLFKTASAGVLSERLRIDSSGRVGVGTTSPGSYTFNQLVVGSSGDQGVTIVSGTTNTGSLAFARGTTGTDAYMGLIQYSHTSDFMRFFTGGTERIRIDSSGRLGIGTTSPTSALAVNNASNDVWAPSSTDGLAFNGGAGGISTITTYLDTSSIRIGAGITQKTGILITGETSGSGSTVQFRTGNSERARINNSGRLLVGTSSARSNYRNSLVPNIQLEEAGAEGGLAVFHNANAATGPLIWLGKSRGTAAGSSTAVQDGDTLGAIRFNGADGANVILGAQIGANVDGAPGTNDLPTRLVFSTTADGASSPTERMRITQGGKVIVNDTAAVLDATFSVLAQSGNNAIALKSNASTVIAIANLWGNETSGNQIFTRFATDSNAERGTIDYNRSAGQVRYNVTSDRRLKSEIIDAPSAVDLVSAIQVRSYKWTETNYKVDYGFIAQELFEVAPDAVKQGDEGEEVTSTWAVDNAKLVPVLTKALQEALIKIESLEARLTAAGI